MITISCQGQVYNAGHSIADGHRANCPSNCIFPRLLCFQKWKCQVKVKCRFRFEYWFSRIASHMDLSIWFISVTVSPQTSLSSYGHRHMIYFSHGFPPDLPFYIRIITSYFKMSGMHCLRNKSWKPECVLSFNMGWQILVFYPDPC